MPRRSNVRSFLVLLLVLFAITFAWHLLRGKRTDLRAIARSKLQLASGARSASCISKEYKFTAKTVTVVVSTQAHQDAVITQTVNSVLAHTNPHMLVEVLIATDKHLTAEKSQLLSKEFASYSSLVRIAHGKSDENFKNKLVIGHLAKGDVVVFIDDTVVVTEGYLEPLLAALESQQELIAVPSFDYLTDLTVSAETSWTQRKWIFDWFLNIQAYELDFQELASKPENEASPAIVFDASAFALSKEYLKKLGSLKNAMAYSGSIDLSFSTWLCGNGALVVPCSRVAKVDLHQKIMVADEKTRQQLAQRFLTKKYLDVMNRLNKQSVKLSDEDKTHMAVETSLQKKCSKDFDWYMSKVVKTDVYVPSDDVLAYGQFDSNSGKICFRQIPAMIFLGHYGCKVHKRATTIEFLKTGQLRMGSECITSSDKGYMVTDPCDYEKDSFKWQLTKSKQFVDKHNRCISHATDPYPEEKQRQVLMFTDCTDESHPESFQWQKWNSFVWLE